MVKSSSFQHGELGESHKIHLVVHEQQLKAMKSITIADVRGHHQRRCVSYVARNQNSLKNIVLEHGHLCQTSSSLNPDS